MALQFGNAKPKLMYGNSKVKLMWGDTKLYSSGSAVSYYDGATLIGTLDVDEGLDVLHPDLPLSKDGYTLVGWQYNGERAETLAANGDNMALYAVYLPNTLVVYQEGSIHDTNYTSGSYSASAVSNYGDQSSASFNIDFKDYQSGSVTWRATRNSNGFGQVTFNGYDYTIYNGTTSVDNIVRPAINGGNTLTAITYSDGRYSTTYAYIKNITLSNPRAWT